MTFSKNLRKVLLLHSFLLNHIFVKVLKNNPGAIEKAINIMEGQKEAISVRLHAVQDETKALDPELNLAREKTDTLGTFL